MTVRVEASSGRGACLTIVSIVCWRWARVDWTNKAKHAPVLAFLVCGVRPSVSMSRASLLLFTSLAHGHPCHHSGIAIPIPVRFPTNPVWAFQLSRSQISTTANLRLNLLLRSRCQIREADGQISICGLCCLIHAWLRGERTRKPGHGPKTSFHISLPEPAT